MDGRYSSTENVFNQIFNLEIIFSTILIFIINANIVWLIELANKSDCLIV